MSDKIVLDKETFKALSQDTRIKILKELKSHQRTQSELAEILSLSVASVKEHLDSLEKAGLIEKDDARKWKYYNLTLKGKSVLEPERRQFMVVLGTTIAAFALSFADLFRIFFWKTSEKASQASLMQTNYAADTANTGLEAAPRVMAKAAPVAAENSFWSNFMWYDYALFGFLLVMIAVFVYCVIRRRRQTFYHD